MTEKNKCSKNSSMTEVKTIYARIALVLLTVNLLLTGYVMTQLNTSVQSQLDTSSQAGTPTQETPKTLGTREKNE
ncbi:hypothetical protein CL634_00135 [bacterium]|nr:hypothetical protein [bacterium]|tara:strand:+ start:328 stop:552 length:225 start_codon:yes stop_codon:yes gene_type:complete